MKRVTYSHCSVVIMIIIIVISCASTKEKNLNNCKGNSSSYTLKLIQNKVISFALDSVTSPNVNYVRLLNINDSLYFTFLNIYTNTIYCYNYNTRNLYKKLKLTSSRKLTGYEIESWNKIITYQYRSKKLTWQNGNGEIVKAIELKKIDGGFYALPFSTAPIIYANNKIYLTGGAFSSSKADKQTPVVAEIDTSFSYVNYLYHFPDIYTKMYFGGVHYRMDIKYTYNREKNLFIFSFPASHQIFTTSNFTDDRGYCAGSKYIDEIPPYRYIGHSKNFKYLKENGYYYAILFDQFENLYYRICFLPCDSKKALYNRKISVIILDSNFNIVGEKLLNDGVDCFKGSYIEAMFVSPDGLMFSMKSKGGDESAMNYMVYKPEKIK